MSEWSGWQLPDDAIAFALQFEGAQRAVQFEFGDFINDLCAELRRPVAQVAERLAHEAGGSKETYRDYARVAAAIPADLRERYEVLSWSQMRACLSGEDAEEVMGWATEVYPLEHGGRPASHAAIYEYTMGRDDGRLAVLYRHYHGLHKRLYKFTVDDRLPEEWRIEVVEFMQRFEKRYQDYRIGGGK